MLLCLSGRRVWRGREKKSKKKKEKEKETQHWGGFDSSRPYPKKTIEGAHNAQSYCSKRIFH